LRERDRLLADRAAPQEADRVAAQQLAHGLQLQLNTANDRWNLEVQQLGPRKQLPDGSWTGGPTPATEALVVHLTRQLAEARASETRLQAAITADAAERRSIAKDLPERVRELAEAQSAQDAFDRGPVP
jgi:hypothetical protein